MGRPSAMYAVFYFVALYFTIVKKLDSGDAGVNLLFYVPGLGGRLKSVPRSRCLANNI